MIYEQRAVGMGSNVMTWVAVGRWFSRRMDAYATVRTNPTDDTMVELFFDTEKSAEWIQRLLDA